MALGDTGEAVYHAALRPYSQHTLNRCTTLAPAVAIYGPTVIPNVLPVWGPPYLVLGC